MNNITFIGAGNMASCIIGGLIANGTAANSITASDPNADSLASLSERFGIQTQQDNGTAAQHADVIVLAVKPQALKAVAIALAAHIKPGALIISIAAGIGESAINTWLGGNKAIVRCMPNTPALVQTGASGLFANAQVNSEQKQFAESLMAATGVVVWLNSEDLIDVVTAVSGSGPAYFFLFMESMIAAGIKQGLTAEQAKQLTLQTAAGAAKLAQESEFAVDELRRRVTSPGGTTEQAVLSFEAAGLRDTVDAAMEACAERSRIMASEFS